MNLSEERRRKNRKDNPEDKTDKIFILIMRVFHIVIYPFFVRSIVKQDEQSQACQSYAMVIIGNRQAKAIQLTNEERDT